ncbi:SDR family oxidoreductase [Frankia gtarii]|uniref:SDR family oxidoreductase n=1 Tax=Frankia gtarii TaxID=2950102 RepID=UPI0021C0A720|nr:SDR family oxidoreductase [Frankia gtarii]
MRSEPTGPLAGRVALITGAGGEIGTAIATELASLGAAVVCNHRDQADRDAAEVAARAARARGPSAMLVAADVSDAAAARHLLDRVEETLGRLDVLVNNAGTAVFGPIAGLTDEQFDAVVSANLRGVFNVCREAAGRLADGGRVLSLSSSSTAMALPGYGLYSATKAAVEQISRALARELGPRGITVNVVSPGPIDTAAFRRGKTPDLIAHFEAASPLGRLGTPADVAGAIGLLCRPEAGWITGQNIRVNGGQV